MKVTKNLILGPILGHLAQIWAPNFFLWVLPLLVIRHCSELSFYPIEKITDKLKKMAKNLILDPILTDSTQIWVQKRFSWILPLLLVTHCCKVSLYAILRKNNDPNLRKWQKTLFQAQIWATKFFLMDFTSTAC